jgi:hypothetical protein
MSKTEKNLEKYHYADNWGLLQNQRVNYYVFWLAEYTSRNSQFREEVGKIREVEKNLKSMSNPHANIGIILGDVTFNLAPELAHVIGHSYIALEKIENLLDKEENMKDENYVLYKKAIKGQKKILSLSRNYFFSHKLPESSSDDLMEHIIRGEDINKDDCCMMMDTTSLSPVSIYSIRKHREEDKILTLNDLYEINSGDAFLSVNFDAPTELIIQAIVAMKDRLARIDEIDEENTNGYEPEVYSTEFESIEGDSQAITHRLGVFDNHDIELIGAYIASKKEISFKVDDFPRVIGLWLWDYCRENDCGATTAIKALRSKYNRVSYANADLLGNFDDKTLERLYKRTEKCIAKPQVLTLRRDA